MICPRCGVINSPERALCARCSGSLAPPAGREDRSLPPIVPLTGRAELLRGNATRAQLAVSPEAGTQLAADQRGDRAQEAGWDLFVLAEHRCTGQPAPPGKAPEERTSAESTERVTGMAIGLSGA